MKNKLPWWMPVQTFILLAWGLTPAAKAHPDATLLLIAVSVVSFAAGLRQWMRDDGSDDEPQR